MVLTKVKEIVPIKAHPPHLWAQYFARLLCEQDQQSGKQIIQTTIVEKEFELKFNFHEKQNVWEKPNVQE